MREPARARASVSSDADVVPPPPTPLPCFCAPQNAGLYGERVGALHVVASSKDEAARLKSQIALLQRSEISSPPAWGARVMAIILNDEALFGQWKREIQVMSGRIIEMRETLRAELEALGTPGSWKHITEQIGACTASPSLLASCLLRRLTRPRPSRATPPP